MKVEDLLARRLPASFYAVDARRLARALLGTCIVHAMPGAPLRVGRVVETEAYCGPDDAACHARFGLTARTRALLGPSGHAYVFLVYGMHECFNVVGGREGAGHAVLVRAVEPVLGVEPGARTDGPGRVSKALGLSRRHDGRSLGGDELFVAEGAPPRRVGRSPRVGVAYAGAMAELPWRFFDAASPHVSRPARGAVGLGLTATETPPRARAARPR